MKATAAEAISGTAYPQSARRESPLAAVAARSEYADVAKQFAAAKAKGEEELRGLKAQNEAKERELAFTVRQGLLMAWFGVLM
jgi:hypothetical protein